MLHGVDDHHREPDCDHHPEGAPPRRLRNAIKPNRYSATAFVATLDDVHRFRDAGQVTSFLGLVPREYSSGEHQHKGAITKTGDRHLRSLHAINFNKIRGRNSPM